MRYSIQCGDHQGIIDAKTLGEAWRKLTQGKTTGFSELARYTGEKDKVWQYITPQALDKLP